MNRGGGWLEREGARYDEWREFALKSLVSLNVGEPETCENVSTVIVVCLLVCLIFVMN